MNKKKFLLLAFLPFISACNSYSYINPEEPQRDLKPAVESGMVMDGFDREEIYQNADSRIFYVGEDNEVKVEFKIAFAEKGMLAFAKVTKSTFFENINLDIFKQDSFELYFNPSNFNDELNTACVQFRLSPLLRRETWIGQKDVASDYAWTKYHKPFNYATHIEGNINTKRGEDIVYANYVGYEYYIPYSTMGLDYNPKGLAILPALVHAKNIVGQYKWYSYENISINDITHYPVFGNKEYRDQTGNVVDSDYCDPGYDLSHQKDFIPVVSQSGWNDQYARVNFPAGRNFDFKVGINLIKGLHADKYPKVGLCLRNNRGKIGFLLDPRPTKDYYLACVVNRNAGDPEWDWDHSPVFYRGIRDYEQPMYLEIIRRENKVYYIMNDGLGYIGDTETLYDEDCSVYLLTMNYYATFFDFETEFDVEKIDQKLAIYNQFEFEQDGDGYGINEDNEISQIGLHDQWLRYKGKSNKYEFSVEVKIGGNLLGDEYPKVGIAEQDSGTIQTFFFDPRARHDNFEMSSCSGSTNPGKRDWEWRDNVSCVFDMNDWNSLKIVRDLETSFYYLNDFLIYTVENNFVGGSTPMLFTMNNQALYKNATFTLK